ncbi:MAG TPA: tRNA (cytidine(34)-2'-O)-methyltransferase [Chthoniobacterales bacterium]|jgi:tRNA (cytidine/uridine-2'-O-)-methyltransferase
MNVVLVSPEIPPNTGNIARLCLAAGASLHLIRPLGFSLDDKYLKRAGMDYWQHVDLHIWDNLEACQSASAPEANWWYLTTKTKRIYHQAAFGKNDYLVFGRETKGLPESLLAENAERCLTIPMQPIARSLNLATSVGIVLYEALRQTESESGAHLSGSHSL